MWVAEEIMKRRIRNVEQQDGASFLCGSIWKGKDYHTEQTMISCNIYSSLLTREASWPGGDSVYLILAWYHIQSRDQTPKCQQTPSTWIKGSVRDYAWERYYAVKDAISQAHRPLHWHDGILAYKYCVCERCVVVMGQPQNASTETSEIVQAEATHIPTYEALHFLEFMEEQAADVEGQAAAL